MITKDKVHEAVDNAIEDTKEDFEEAKKIKIDWKKVGIFAGSAVALTVGGIFLYKSGLLKTAAKTVSEVAPEVADTVVEAAPEVAEAVL